jgi:hypothetical protein
MMHEEQVCAVRPDQAAGSGLQVDVTEAALVSCASDGVNLPPPRRNETFGNVRIQLRISSKPCRVHGTQTNPVRGGVRPLVGDQRGEGLVKYQLVPPPWWWWAVVAAAAPPGVVAATAAACGATTTDAPPAAFSGGVVKS